MIVSQTYTEKKKTAGPHVRCKRCRREHPYPQAGAPAIYCECGWWYANDAGKIVEEFKPRLGT